jgi:hypothetical protein
LTFKPVFNYQRQRYKKVEVKGGFWEKKFPKIHHIPKFPQWGKIHTKSVPSPSEGSIIPQK